MIAARCGASIDAIDRPFDDFRNDKAYLKAGHLRRQPRRRRQVAHPSQPDSDGQRRPRAVAQGRRIGAEDGRSPQRVRCEGDWGGREGGQLVGATTLRVMSQCEEGAGCWEVVGPTRSPDHGEATTDVAPFARHPALRRTRPQRRPVLWQRVDLAPRSTGAPPRDITGISTSRRRSTGRFRAETSQRLSLGYRVSTVVPARSVEVRGQDRLSVLEEDCLHLSGYAPPASHYCRDAANGTSLGDGGATMNELYEERQPGWIAGGAPGNGRSRG